MKSFGGRAAGSLGRRDAGLHRPEPVLREDPLPCSETQELEERLGHRPVAVRFDRGLDDRRRALDQERRRRDHVRNRLLASCLVAQQDLVLVGDDGVAGSALGEIGHALPARLVHVDDVGLHLRQEVAHRLRGRPCPALPSRDARNAEP